jgi:hypothetical protein
MPHSARSFDADDLFFIDQTALHVFSLPNSQAWSLGTLAHAHGELGLSLSESSALTDICVALNPSSPYPLQPRISESHTVGVLFPPGRRGQTPVAAGHSEMTGVFAKLEHCGPLQPFNNLLRCPIIFKKIRMCVCVCVCVYCEWGG